MANHPFWSNPVFSFEESPGTPSIKEKLSVNHATWKTKLPNELQRKMYSLVCMEYNLSGPREVSLVETSEPYWHSHSRDHSTREQNRERERNPKADLSLLDERPFYLLAWSLWWEPWLAGCQSCRQGGWPHREGKWQASLGFGTMYARQTISIQVS